MTPPTGYTTLALSDDFNSLDLTRWKITTAQFYKGYGQEIWDAANVAVYAGVLELLATADLHSGEIRSLASFPPPTYFEARMKLPKTVGFWPGFWGVTPFTDVAPYSRQEIDVAECNSSTPHVIGQNLHWGTKATADTDKHNGSWTDLSVDFQADFHTYGVLYLSDRIGFYVDDVLRQTWTQPVPAVLYDPMELRLSLSIFGSNQTWALPPDATTAWPQTLLVDWVRVWQPTVPPPSDTLPPLITILSPANGHTVSRKTKINVQVSASDNVGITKIELTVNNVLIDTSTFFPYPLSFTTSGKPNASYHIEVRAYDLAGNTGWATATVKT